MTVATARSGPEGRSGGLSATHTAKIVFCGAMPPDAGCGSLTPSDQSGRIVALTDEQIRLSLELVVIYLAFGRHYRARQRLAQSRRDAGWRPDQPVGRLGRRNDAGRREASSGG